MIDCPPTPEIILHSSTPPLTSLLDMLNSSSSSEEVDNCDGENEEDGALESGRNSPPPKCAICLGRCRQKCCTNSCRHQFCYRCLLEWSKIKAECPLCKQVFRSIIYNQKSVQVSIGPTANRDGQGGTGSAAAAAAAASAQAAGRAAPQVYHRLDFTLTQPPRFTYSATLRVQPSQSERLQQLFLHQSGDVQRFSREFPDDSIPSRQNGPEWRRYIYHRRLHARPLPDINGRLRECSASFYRENPAQIHRLMPWINRELIALCRGNPSQVTLILEDFPNLLMTHDITSPSFRERVSYWGRARTTHFVHELLNFARSPYDMIGYDRCVQYDPYYNSVVVLSSSSSSSSGSGLSGSDGEDDVVRIVEPVAGTSGMVDSLDAAGGNRRGRTQFTIETRSSDQTVIMTGSFGGSGVSGIVSVSTSGTQTNGAAPAASSSNSTATSAAYPDVPRMHPLTSMAPQMSRLEDGANISLSSDDSDDCRIVGALKPPHLRTPEMVSLESESDSDVIFVNGDENRSENPSTQLPSVAESQDSIVKLDNHSAASASEYNNGASTSSGSGGGCMKKYYAKPKLNRYSDGIGFKSIYEASESERSKEPSIPSDSDSSSHSEVKFNIHTQPSINLRKRKIVKRRQRSSSGSSDDQSSTSDTESTHSSSTSSPSSSVDSSTDNDSDSDSNFEPEKPPKTILKIRSRRTNAHSSNNSSKRRRKNLKKHAKVKKRKLSSSKRSRRRQKTSPKTAKSSSESGKGTSVSCTSVPSMEAVPSGSNSPPKQSPVSSKKRKLRSAVIKPSNQSHHPSSKKRRKVPICSELITSTDFSSEENQPEQQQILPTQQTQEPAATSSSASFSENDSSDSEEGCTIASLIRASQQHHLETEGAEDLPVEQNTYTSSANTTTCSSSSHTETSNSTFSDAPQQLQQEQHQPAVEEDISVSQAISVGAEVEL